MIPTLRGIGVTAAVKPIQIDRYSAKSNDGVSVDFIDTADRFNDREMAPAATNPGTTVYFNCIGAKAKGKMLFAVK